MKELQWQKDEKLKIAKRMLKIGIDIENITTCMGLSMEDIKGIEIEK